MFQLHKLGWHNFQQLSLTILREILGQTVESFLDSNDAGRDGAFIGKWNVSSKESLKGRFVFQCKFSEKASYNLKVSDIKEEIPKIEKLVAQKRCDCYILITNTRLTGATQLAIEKRVLATGVKQFKAFESTWIEDQIQKSSKLRMLVPRIYGLGDLSQILDERALLQARAILDSLSGDMAKVVRTSAYEKAANAIEKHGFVLLVGAPAVGKSTIASLLAMASLDRYETSTIKVDDVFEMKEHWNPLEPKRFYWVDDAFGVTQYESHLVRGWNHLFPQIKTMLNAGAKIVMTSRDYIYNRARQELKESAFPLLNESQVVIDVKDLTSIEKKQILYNHLKLGNQSPQFIKAIKPFLEIISDKKEFVPETARRLSDPAFTKNLLLYEFSLLDFVVKQNEFLLDTIGQLDKDSKAALAMIYIHGGSLESPVNFNLDEKEMLERMDSSKGQCINSLNFLKDSFVQLSQGESESHWRFKHPTISDAFSAYLYKNQELMGIYLTGTHTDELMRQITCGNVGLKEAIVVSKTFFRKIIDKLKTYALSPADKHVALAKYDVDQRIFTFLSYRCSKEFLSLYVRENPELLDRIASPGLMLEAVPEVPLVLTLQQYDLLPENYRKKFVECVVAYTKKGQDFYVIESERLHSLFTSEELKELFTWIEQEFMPKLHFYMDRHINEWDKTFDTAEEHMDSFLVLLQRLEERYEENVVFLRKIETQKEEANAWVNGNDSETSKQQRDRWSAIIEADELATGIRSIFDDIDLD